MSARISTSSARPSTSSATAVSMSFPTIRADDYAHSPVHYAVATGDHATLSRLVLSLPRLADPDQIRSEYDSLAQEQLADRISAAVDRRDVPGRETPLHLAVRLSDSAAARTLAAAGADVSLQNAAGWNPLQEALCRRSSDVALILLRCYHSCAWAKWRRRLPRLVAVLRRMRDFYMEISFHFESSIVPFVGKIAPSDTYKIWKRDGNLRADTSLAGFDGLKIQRVDQSFLFLGDGDCAHNIAPGSLLVLNRDDKNISDAFEHAGAPMSESDIAGFCAQTTVYRPGMDVTRAELVGRMNWRRQEKTETVGKWKARVYEVHNVVFSFRSKKLVVGSGGGGDADVAAGSEQVLPLELDEDEEGFLVAENPTFGTGGRRHSSFVREDAKYVAAGRRSVGIPERPRMLAAAAAAVAVEASPVQTKEKEYVRSLRPSVWLTDQFPLNTEELLPLLDILANKVKAVRRMRELLTTKFPPGTFPVKVAIPVVPTVRVLITFTKFVELPPTEQFYTPLSSPRQFQERQGVKAEERPEASEDAAGWSTRRPPSLSSSSAWMKRSNSTKSATMQQHLLTDPFTIPGGYTWKSSKDDRNQKMKKSKSTRKSSK